MHFLYASIGLQYGGTLLTGDIIYFDCSLSVGRWRFVICSLVNLTGNNVSYHIVALMISLRYVTTSYDCHVLVVATLIVVSVTVTVCWQQRQ